MGGHVGVLIFLSVLADCARCQQHPRRVSRLALLSRAPYFFSMLKFARSSTLTPQRKDS